MPFRQSLRARAGPPLSRAPTSRSPLPIRFLSCLDACTGAQQRFGLVHLAEHGHGQLGNVASLAGLLTRFCQSWRSGLALVSRDAPGSGNLANPRAKMGLAMTQLGFWFPFGRGWNILPVLPSCLSRSFAAKRKPQAHIPSSPRSAADGAAGMKAA